MRFGDVTDRATLIPVFEWAEGCRVIHCAGMVSVAAGQGEALGRINVQGTENIAGLCLEYGAKRLVYVSSVHAIPESQWARSSPRNAGYRRSLSTALTQRARPPPIKRCCLRRKRGWTRA